MNTGDINALRPHVAQLQATLDAINAVIGAMVPDPSSVAADSESTRYIIRSIDSLSPSSKFPELRDCGGMSTPLGMTAAQETIKAIISPPNPGRIVDWGPESDYHMDSACGALVPNGYHAEFPLTTHDGSRDWISTDFWAIVPDGQVRFDTPKA